MSHIQCALVIFCIVIGCAHRCLLSAEYDHEELLADFPRYVEVWSDPALQHGITERIEKHRKADAVIEVIDAEGNPVPDVEVTATQQTHAFLFGCNAFVVEQLDDQFGKPEWNEVYTERFTHLFNLAVVPFYWSNLEPELGNPRFEESAEYIWRRPPPNVVVAWGKENNLVLKGHPLFFSNNYHHGMPGGMKCEEWTAERRLELTEPHVKRLGERYGEDIAIWDLDNELGAFIRREDDMKYQQMPEGWLKWLFTQADQAFPESALLMINDVRRGSYVEDVIQERLIDEGAPLDAIGIQAHQFNAKASQEVLEGSDSAQDWLNFLEDAGRFGLPLAISEITIAQPFPDERGQRLQAIMYEDYYRFWFSIPQMHHIILWNLGDALGYRPKGTEEAGYILDAEMQPKPAYHTLDRLINQEWKTTASGRTDADGKFTFRGFKGDYTLTVNQVSPGDPLVLRLRVDGDTRKIDLQKDSGTGSSFS